MARAKLGAARADKKDVTPEEPHSFHDILVVDSVLGPAVRAIVRSRSCIVQPTTTDARKELRTNTFRVAVTRPGARIGNLLGSTPRITVAPPSISLTTSDLHAPFGPDAFARVLAPTLGQHALLHAPLFRFATGEELPLDAAGFATAQLHGYWGWRVEQALVVYGLLQCTTAEEVAIVLKERWAWRNPTQGAVRGHLRRAASTASDALGVPLNALQMKTWILNRLLRVA